MPGNLRNAGRPSRTADNSPNLDLIRGYESALERRKTGERLRSHAALSRTDDRPASPHDADAAAWYAATQQQMIRSRSWDSVRQAGAHAIGRRVDINTMGHGTRIVATPPGMANKAAALGRALTRRMLEAVERALKTRLSGKADNS